MQIYARRQRRIHLWFAAPVLPRCAIRIFFLLALALTGETSLADQQPVIANNGQPPALSYELLKIEEHDPSRFTQGLILHQGEFFESTGLYRRSGIFHYSAETNTLLNHYPLNPQQFAEGLTLLNKTLYLLTWKNGQLHTFDLALNPLNTLIYKGEGWGLTDNGKQLIMSNGSADLLFRNPDTLDIERVITANSPHPNKTKAGPKIWENLNELEYVDGIIWANQWQTEHILAIDAATGKVLAILPLTQLVREQQASGANVLNGIAYSAEENGFWVTGKLWNKRYLIRPSSWPKSSQPD